MRHSCCPVIDVLPSRERDKLLARAVPRRLAKGQPLFFAGEPVDRVYVVEAGLLKLTASDASGFETILGLAGEGEALGATDAVVGTRHYDATGATPCDLLTIDANAFLTTVLTHPASSFELVRAAATRERWSANAILERTAGPVPVRLAGRLLDLSEMCGRMSGGTIEMDLPLCQEDLGRFAGMCRESTCKTLRRFQRAGVVDYRGKKLRILRPDVLERLRCGARAAEPSP